MKLAFIADIHSNRHAFESVLVELKKQNIDEIFCCGDIVGYYAYPIECIEIIQKNKIISVMGNHDQAVIDGKLSWFNDDGKAGIRLCMDRITKENIQFLYNLSYKKTFTRDGISFYLTHGSPRDNLFEYIHPWFSDKKLIEISKNADADYIITGHTHIQMEAKVGSKTFLNPGSIGQPRDGIPKASFMVFDTEKYQANWFRVLYDIKSAAQAVYDNNLPYNLAKRLFDGK